MSDLEHETPVILFVDDEVPATKYFQRAIGTLAAVVTASSVEKGKQLLDEHHATLRVLVSDQRMPGAFGNELLEYARVKYPEIVRMLTTAYSEMEQTIEAVNQGHIYRYLQKPWEITALRMELKQALDLANLRRERAFLLREKLGVRQKQLTGTRIGMLHALCATLTGSGVVTQLEAYLSAVNCATTESPEPDWLLMDYADLASAEAFRNGAFGNAVGHELQALRKRFDHADAFTALTALVEAMDGQVTLDGAGGVMFRDEKLLTEYLETATTTTVSHHHARWLAFLLWLESAQLTVEVRRDAQGVHAKLIALAARTSPERLATWIENFS
jgi:two-component system probable response regulator PhcQ